MQKFVIVGLFLGVLFASMGLVLAQEFVVEDNACLTGGIMEGKCDLLTDAEDDWAWTCGWYVHRYYTGEFTRNEVIETCRGLIPIPPTPLPSLPPDPESTPEPTPDPQVCAIFFSGSYTLCRLGTLLRQDAGNDGSFEISWYISSGSVSGNDGNCPAGSTFGGSEIASYEFVEPDFYAWLTGFGFGNYDDLCTII